MIANTPAAWSEQALLESPHAAVRWSAQGQRERHEAVLAALDPQPGETLLDFGCGTGALCELVPADVRYVGYDWADGMLTRARIEHPGVRFVSALMGSLPYTVAYFDVIACIGPFNLPDNWSKAQTWRTLDGLWGRSRRALAACLYAGDDPACLAYTEAEIASYAATTGARFTVTRDRPNDLLLLLERDKEVML